MSSPSVAAAAAAAMPVATASASASASTSASASASASSTSPRLSSSPHSSSSSDTVTCAPSAFSPSSGTASALDTHHHATVLERLVLNDAIDLTADSNLGHRPPPLSLSAEEQNTTSSLPAFSVPEAISSAADPDTAMIFSDFYKGRRSPLSRLRGQSPQPSANSPPWLVPEYIDLFSKDKYRQKDTIKKYLAAKVKNNWNFQWSPPRKSKANVTEKPCDTDEEKKPSVKESEPQAIRVDSAKDIRDDDADAEAHVDSSALSDNASDHEDVDADNNDDDTDSIYSLVSEDPVNYRPRMDWYSDLSEDEATITSVIEGADCPARTSALEKKARRRKAAREEMAWNEGLACFQARRDAWTGAKTARVRSKPIASPPVSPRSRRFFFRRSISGSPPSLSLIKSNSHADSRSGTASDASSLVRDDKDLSKQGSKDSDQTSDRLFPVETLLPIPHPILPPTNGFRASITPAIYLSLYDKVILNSLQPSCPINLSDMIRSCVMGWKRDGEWPPKPSGPEPTIAAGRRKKAKMASGTTGSSIGVTARRMSLGLLGRDKDDNGIGIRKSLQKALGLGTQPGNPQH
ncbi:hypothetical protein ACSS6W_010582 [Trichoderma asperelloides]